jgi:hypothetical protein
MSLRQVREKLRHEPDGKQLLESLPSHNSFTWIPWKSFGTVDLPEALVLGTNNGRDIVAFVTQKGDKPHEVRYCSKPKGISSGYSTNRLSQDEVVTMSLDVPFKYNADLSKGNKRKFSVIVKWYFMVRGLLNHALSGDIDDWCRILLNALQKIANASAHEKGKGNRGRGSLKASREMPAVIQNSPEPVERNSTYGLRSAQRGENGHTVEEAPSPVRPQPEPRQTRATGGPSDYEVLSDYLEERNLSYLLKNIHEADELEWFDGRLSPESLPKKLYLGKNQNNDNIYAHIRVSRGTHSVHCWSRDLTKKIGGITLQHQDIGKQTIVHPFNKTYTKDRRSLTTADQDRLDVLVKWYFIAAGIATNIVLRETPSYPDRLVDTLAYIADRMGPAAAAPPSATPPPEPTAPIPTPPIDESQIQSSLAKGATGSPKPSPRGTKRSAEEADWDYIHRNVTQDIALTARVNTADEELEMWEMKKQNHQQQSAMKKQNLRDQLDQLGKQMQDIRDQEDQLEMEDQSFIDQWEMEHDSKLEKRERIAAEREDVRKKFRRLSRNVGEEE